MRITENELVQNTYSANHDGFLDILAFTSFFANHDFEKNGDYSDSILPEWLKGRLIKLVMTSDSKEDG